MNQSEWFFWNTMRRLTPSVLDRVRPAKDAVLAAARGSPEAGARALLDCLMDVEWDWPDWYPFAARESEWTLRAIAVDVEKLEVAEALGLATKAELLALCGSHGVVVASGAKKAEIIEALCRAVSAPSALTESFVRREVVKMQRRCRERMALFLVRRISSFMYNAERYEQLEDTGAKFWMFRVGGFGGEPESCRRFDGMVLPAAEAREKFPRLPCDAAVCRCRIVGTISPEFARAHLGAE